MEKKINNTIKETIEELQEKFNEISKKGYIKGIYNSLSSIGRTFENELNLPMNKECVADYYGIEIKTRRTYSKSAITLFTAVPDGEERKEIERLKNMYGYPYKRDKKYKALYVDVYGNKLTYGGVKYQYKLDIDKIKEKVYLCVYDRYGNLLERKVYWTYKYLENKLLNKLSYLAIVNVWTNEKDGWNYFKYYKISFFKLKGFNIFLKLLEDGIIKIGLKIDIYLDENNYGKTYDHGCSFAIREKDIIKLFNKIKK